MTYMPPEKRINPAQLRQMFNDGDYWARAQAGEFRVEVMTEKHPAPERSGQPLCTLSQFLAYFDKQGQEIARVHQYLRPDQKLGGSGQPDPKRLFINGIIYKI